MIQLANAIIIQVNPGLYVILMSQVDSFDTHTNTHYIVILG